MDSTRPRYGTTITAEQILRSVREYDQEHGLTPEVEPQWLRANEAARVLGDRLPNPACGLTHHRQLRILANKGLIRAALINGRYRYDEDSLLKYAAAVDKQRQSTARV